MLAVGSALTSHAAGRVEHRGLLLTLDGLHQVAVATWVGGLAHLTAVAFSKGARPWPAQALRRFSAVALTAVTILVAAGVGLTVYYVDGIEALIGTAYGMMLSTKVVILGGLLVLGALNFTAVRGLRDTDDVLPLRLRRFVEVELGLGLTVLFAAASLTSLPPAVDVVRDRATLEEVATRFTPRMPALSSPRLADMPIDDPHAPRTDADRAWSEYNHHFAGFFVLSMGLLAVCQAGGARWARHWPLLFLGLAVFLLIRNDPGAWPLGPQGFWEGFAYPEVLQHRIFVLLVVAFGIFEWAVRTGRLRSPGWALIFPAAVRRRRRPAAHALPRLAQSEGRVPDRGHARAARRARDDRRLGPLAGAAPVTPRGADPEPDLAGGLHADRGATDHLPRKLGARLPTGDEACRSHRRSSAGFAGATHFWGPRRGRRGPLR